MCNMNDNNNTCLFDYELNYFGYFYKEKPKSFFDLKSEKYPSYNPNFGHLQYDLYKFANDKTHTYNQYIPGVCNSFFDRKNGINFPKKLPITKISEFELVNKTCPTIKAKIYYLLCVFPTDFNVPWNCKIIKFYGQAKWFRPYITEKEEIKQLLNNIKKDFFKKR